MQSSSPSSSKIISGTKRKEPASSTILQTLPVVENHQSFHGNPTTEIAPTDHILHSLLCNLVFSSDFNLEQHLRGQKHQAKLRELLEHPSPSNIFSGTNGIEPASVLQTQTLPMLEKHLLESAQTYHRLHCKLCNVVCSSDFNLEQHMKGQKHQGKLQELVNGQRRWCEVCKIPCMNEELLKMHLEGRKHKARLLELNLSAAKGEGEIPPERRNLYCKLCQVWCIDECSFKQHLEGKKHKLLLVENFSQDREASTAKNPPWNYRRNR